MKLPLICAACLCAWWLLAYLTSWAAVALAALVFALILGCLFSWGGPSDPPVSGSRE